ncbi:gliding motility-associated C-terminal domain-containing protein [Belliella sp. R4-6]|uniref:Gliding motility-associated C-terminal domain-containing protein n=1 Tax=Belliella alkalica TaxID=1730871 RepID=A0ABS9V6H0_9BACT|nr:gliding motility-associated C-terminal domain-containing protein [Belliella alkalica]MCH7412012.1 gliding motility-associated C-terminal domain-containing protein [Belliella alkalica]
MKNYFKLFLTLTILFFITADLFSQSLTLVSDAKISLKQEDVILSAPSIKLFDTSQIIQAEKVRLTQSDFIQLLSANASLRTRVLKNGEKAHIQVGIGSKADIVIINRSASGAYSIGMDRLNDSESLPFLWKISSLNSNMSVDMVDLQFFWDKDAEPLDFQLKSLMKREGEDWMMEYDQEIQDTDVQLRRFSFIDSKPTAFTIATNRLDSDEDGVPDIIEIREGTDPKDPTDYLDTDGDKVPDYIENIQNTNPLDPISYLDSNQDGVPDYVRDRSPIMFINLSNVQIPWGFSSIDTVLPDSLIAVLGSGKIINMNIIWDKSNLDIFKRGIYDVSGSFELSPGLFDAYQIPSNMQMEVLPKPAPEDIRLSNNVFDAEKSGNEVVIGSLTVLDPFDNQHNIQLSGLAFDNVYFEIRDGVLFWSSEYRADGQTRFRILISVHDRDGNVLEKEFTIIRNRMSVSDIEIVNTFTPNGDGMNDTWGVRELRFYTGVTLQVFERSGKRVFYTQNPDDRWDGTFNNIELPIGTYYWTVEVEETGEIRRGMLNLLRK